MKFRFFVLFLLFAGLFTYTTQNDEVDSIVVVGEEEELLFPNVTGEEEVELEPTPPQPQPQPTTKLVLDRIYKTGGVRLCQRLKRKPVVASVFIQHTCQDCTINLTMVLDHVDKSEIHLDDHAKPSESVFLNCFMDVAVYSDDRFMIRTDSFKMNPHIDGDLELFFLGLAEEFVSLEYEPLARDWIPIGDRKWKVISKEWMGIEVRRFRKVVEKNLKITRYTKDKLWDNFVEAMFMLSVLFGFIVLSIFCSIFCT
jgi:hypothetical protein